MTISTFRLCATVALSFAAGALLMNQWTRIEKVRADSSRVFELRVYHTLPGRLPALQSRFRDHTLAIFKKHGMTSVGYWTPQDSPASENTLIYILAHDSRAAADKHWTEFRQDPEWMAVSKASEADGKIVEKVDSTFMAPADYSPLK
jgi:NIPSNAP protein